jgi:hypothetical protein
MVQWEVKDEGKWKEVVRCAIGSGRNRLAHRPRLDNCQEEVYFKLNLIKKVVV